MLDATAKATLVQALVDLFTSGNAGGTSVDAANNLAEAYDAYAQNALSCSGLGPSRVDLEGLRAALIPAMSGTNPSGSAAAVKWAAAFPSYWTGALFGASGSVVVPGLSATLSAALGPVLDNVGNTTLEAAEGLADALEAFTKTVTVYDSVAQCGPLPVT